MSSFLLKNALSIIWLSVSLALFPLFRDQYTDAKWLVFYFLFGGVFLIYGLNQKFSSCQKNIGRQNISPTIIGIQVPVLNRHIGLSLTGLLFFYTLSYLANLPSHSTQIVFQWFILLGTIIFVNLTHMDRSVFSPVFLFFASLTIFLVGGISIFQWMGFHPLQTLGFQHFWRNDFPASTFGFQNFTAQCIALSLLVTNSYLMNWPLAKGRREKQSSIQRYLIQVISILGLVCLFLYGSRSSILSYIFAISVFGWIFFRTQRKLKWQYLIQFAGCMFLIWTGFFSGLSEYRKEVFVQAEYQKSTTVLQNSPSQKSDVLENFGNVKSTNANIRLIRWKNTMVASLKFPLGMGPGGFSYGYLPFSRITAADIEANEKLVPTNPHNGYLELLIENGWFSLACLAYLMSVLALFLIRELFSKKKVNALSDEELDQWIATSWLIFLTFDALFAFPMEVPLPFLAFGIGVGTLLKSVKKKKVFFLPIVFWKYNWIGYGILIFLISSLITTAKLSEANPASFRKHQSLLCRAIPEIWINCIEASKVEEAMGRRSKAIELLDFALRGQPNLFPVLETKLHLESRIHGNDISFPCATYKRIKETLPSSNIERLEYWRETCIEK